MSVQFEGQGLSISASVGVAEAKRDDDEWKVVRRADDCIYASKSAGRNCAYWHNGTNCEPVSQSTPHLHRPTSNTAGSSLAGTYAALPDVNAFLTFLQRRIAEIARSGEHLAVIRLKIDLAGGFRQIPVEALDCSAQVVRCALRDMDLIGRGRAGELLILLPRCTAAAARIVANRMAAEIRSTKVTSDDAVQCLSCQVDVEEAEVDDEARELLDRLTHESCRFQSV
jgi:GGDEF domain-containing protein